jgi:hypothetical protein
VNGLRWSYLGRRVAIPFQSWPHPHLFLCHSGLPRVQYMSIPSDPVSEPFPAHESDKIVDAFVWRDARSAQRNAWNTRIMRLVAESATGMEGVDRALRVLDARCRRVRCTAR